MFVEACAHQAAILWGGLKVFGAVLDQDEGTCGQHVCVGRAAEETQRLGVGGIIFVGRIEEDQVDGCELLQTREQRRGASFFKGVVPIDLQVCQVCLKASEGGRRVFREKRVLGAAGDRLKAHGAGTGEEIDKACALDARAKNIEERLAKPVAGGPGRSACRGGKGTGTVGSGDDTHGSMVTGCQSFAAAAHTIGSMNGWSFRIGRVFGVELRLHSFFIFLLAPSAVWAFVTGRSPVRGVALWGLLLIAVAVRETARGIAAAYFYLDVKSVLLLPTGGIPAYAARESEVRAEQRGVQRVLALSGPLANLVFGLMLAGFIVTISPVVSLLMMPWISPAHLLRSIVWVNLMLGLLNFLPAWPLDGVRLFRGVTVQKQEGQRGTMDRAEADMPASRRLPGRLGVIVRLSRWFALSLVIYGILSANLWVMMAGLGILLGAQVERRSLMPERETDATRVGDVMLTEYSILPASATLEDAMLAARHSLQDVFPVVRAGNMVGAVGRQSILEALASSGNGYVQGIMIRSFQTAGVHDSLMDTLNQAVSKVAGASLQIVPVVEGEVVVGILTPQHLQRSLGLISGRVVRAGRTAEDETD